MQYIYIFHSILVKGASKRLFIPYNFSIGHSRLTNSYHAKEKGNVRLQFRFPQVRLRRNDPLRLVYKHFTYVCYLWPYAHEKDNDMERNGRENEK